MKKWHIVAIDNSSYPIGSILREGEFPSILLDKCLPCEGQSFEEIKKFPELIEILKNGYKSVPDLRE